MKKIFSETSSCDNGNKPGHLLQKRAGRQWVRVAAEIGGAVLLVAVAYVFRHEITNLLSSMSVARLAASVTVALATNLLLANWFARLLNSRGLDIPVTSAIGVFLLGNVSKYIPGKVASFAHQYFLFDSAVPMRVVAAVNIELMLLTMGISTLIGGGLLAAGASTLAAAGALVLIFAYSEWMVRQNVVAMLMKRIRFGSEWLEKAPQPKAGLKAGVMGVMFACGYVLAHALVLEDLLHAPAMDMLTIIGVLALSWVAGTLAFIFPAGIGIRELTFVSIGTAFTGQEQIATMAGIAILLRVWQILHELVGGLLGVLVLRFVTVRGSTVKR